MHARHGDHSIHLSRLCLCNSLDTPPGRLFDIVSHHFAPSFLQAAPTLAPAPDNAAPPKSASSTKVPDPASFKPVYVEQVCAYVVHFHTHADADTHACILIHFSAHLAQQYADALPTNGCIRFFFYNIIAGIGCSFCLFLLN